MEKELDQMIALYKKTGDKKIAAEIDDLRDAIEAGEKAQAIAADASRQKNASKTAGYITPPVAGDAAASEEKKRRVLDDIEELAEDPELDEDSAEKRQLRSLKQEVLANAITPEQGEMELDAHARTLGRGKSSAARIAEPPRTYAKSLLPGRRSAKAGEPAPEENTGLMWGSLLDPDGTSNLNATPGFTDGVASLYSGPRNPAAPGFGWGAAAQTSPAPSPAIPPAFGTTTSAGKTGAYVPPPGTVPLPKPRPYPEERGIYQREGLEIRPDFGGEYSIGATAAAEPFENIVVHHTGDELSFDQFVEIGHEYDPGRGGYFGYHFYVGPDGQIVQGAPLTVRTNGILPYPSVFRNANTIHVAMTGTQDTHTPAQIAAASDLVGALADDFFVLGNRIASHGNIQANRGEERANEGIRQVLGNVGALDDNILRWGDGTSIPDDRVLVAQTALNDWSARTGRGGELNTTGQFNEETAQAVLEFQEAKGLPRTGFVDSETQSALLEHLLANNPAFSGLAKVISWWP